MPNYPRWEHIPGNGTMSAFTRRAGHAENDYGALGNTVTVGIGPRQFRVDFNKMGWGIMWEWSRSVAERAAAASWTASVCQRTVPSITDPEPWLDGSGGDLGLRADDFALAR